MRVRFHQSLGDLKEKLLVMAGMAEQSIGRAVEAYTTGDTSLCAQVEQQEVAINQYERQIDQMALDLLAMEQPMAIDLRFILAVIKINADLERVGDSAKSIAQRACDLHEHAAGELPVDIPRMASLATDMVRRALQSFVEGDADAAQQVLSLDDAVDKLNRTMHITLLNTMQEKPHLAQPAMQTLLVARSLERVADHATNIAEDVIFWIRGADVRHYVPSGAAETLPAGDGPADAAGNGAQ